MRGRIAAVGAALLAAGLAAACTTAVRGGGSAPPPAAPHPPFTAPQSLAHATGIVTANLAAFDAKCGCTPDLAVRYVRWGESAQAANLAYDLEHGAVPLAELEPYGVTLAQVAAGTRDAYLTAFARQVASLHSLVLMSFAPEANNDSYPWGFQANTPAGYIAAWRHVVEVFRSAGAADVRWTWVVNASGAHTALLAPMFPGTAYVQFAGVDGYATHAYTTFSGLFGATVAQVRKLAGAPVMITETGADAEAGQERWLSQLAAGVRSDDLAGFAWFDVNQAGGQDPGAPKGNRHDWAIDSNPAALAAFRAAVKEYG